MTWRRTLTESEITKGITLLLRAEDPPFQTTGAATFNVDQGDRPGNTPTVSATITCEPIRRAHVPPPAQQRDLDTIERRVPKTMLLQDRALVSVEELADLLAELRWHRSRA